MKIANYRLFLGSKFIEICETLSNSESKIKKQNEQGKVKKEDMKNILLLSNDYLTCYIWLIKSEICESLNLHNSHNNSNDPGSV